MKRLLYSVTPLLMFTLVAAASWSAQDQEVDEIRDLLRVKRTSASSGTAKGRRQPWKDNKPAGTLSAEYQRRNDAQADSSHQAGAGDALLGVTLYRLRPSIKNDAVEIKDLIQPDDGSPVQEWTPERIEANTPLREGQMVRLTIESFRTGYLYVINRSKYRDGIYGDPYLIFPTQRIYGGDNKVEPGKVIQIPGPEDRPGYLVVKRGKPNAGELQTGEELIIIIKPEPFENFKTLPADRKLLTVQSVQSLIDKYTVPQVRSEMKGGAGQAITVAEVKAARERTRRLNEDDPLPQSVYRTAVKATDPMLVRFELKVGAN